jgi:hypothetical protein
LYIPDFRDEILDSGRSLFDVKEEYLQLDWLTPGLVDEIEQQFPVSIEIDATNRNQRDYDAYLTKIAVLFPIGRRFASFKQLTQACEMFLEAWAIVKVHSQKKIRCFYGSSTKKKRDLHIIPEKRRDHIETLKEEYKCPFEIRYSFVDYHKDSKHPDKRPDLFYFVKITRVHYHHTCSLNTEYARQAKQRNGKCQPNLDGMNDILSLLKAKPMLKAEDLRPLLLKHVVVYKDIDAVFICNFRCRALHHIARNSGKDLSMEDVRLMISKSIVASDECMDIDDPIARENFTELLRKVMQEGSSTWDAIRFMDQIKDCHIGFDYCLKFDSFGRPEAIMWMFPHQRRNLLRYGHTVFLDGQKKQFNDWGWPIHWSCR